MVNLRLAQSTTPLFKTYMILESKNTYHLILEELRNTDILVYMLFWLHSNWDSVCFMHLIAKDKFSKIA